MCCALLHAHTQTPVYLSFVHLETLHIPMNLLLRRLFQSLTRHHFTGTETKLQKTKSRGDSKLLESQNWRIKVFQQ